MPRASRFHRPSSPEPIELTQRDRDVLRSLAQFKHLTSDHLRLLVFPAVNRSVCVTRLRKLWQNKFIERVFFPFIMDGTQESQRNGTTPVYCLARRGVEVVAASGVSDIALLEPPIAFSRLQHDLVSTDLLVAVAAAAREHPEIQEHALYPEHHLWGTVLPWRSRAPSGAVCLVPDGAFTLHFTNGTSWTFAIEVVKADVKRGNQTLFARMEQYVQLNRAGFFKTCYGWDTLRAVLILTTTNARAENFRQLAEHLPHGKRLFWFTGYEKEKSAGPPTTIFTPTSILDDLWQDADRNRQRLVPRSPLATLSSARTATNSRDIANSSVSTIL